MAVTVKQARYGQRVEMAEVKLAVTDTVLNTSSAETLVAASAVVADMIALPNGAVVVGGEIVVDAVFDTSGTATIGVGDSVSAARYATGVNLKAAARTALTLTGFVNTEGLPVRLTIANNGGGAGAVGTVRVRVMYIRDGRAETVN